MKARRILSLLLALAMVITLLPMPARAEESIPEASPEAAPETEAVIVPEPLPEEPAKPERFTATIPFQVNPLYEGLYTPDPEDIPQFPKQEGAAPQAANYQTVEEASVLVRSYMKSRTESYTVYVKSESSDYNAVFAELLNLAVEHTGVGNEGDYLMWHLAGYGAELSREYSNGYYNYTYDIVTPYYTTAAQEQELTIAVNNLIYSLPLWGKSDYEKVCTVYDYICDNIVYDFENLEDTEYGLKFSAYAALVNKTAVCQGYALLFYRIMLELGIDARFIGGDGGGPHAWNIVNLGDYYYNVDATWDAGLTEYENFLKSTWTFYNHYRDPEFDYWEFHMDYPMAAEDYVDGETATLDPYINMGYCGTEDMEYLNAAWAMMRDGTLVIAGEGATLDYTSRNIPYWYYWIDHIEKAEITEGITYIGEYIFYKAPNLKSVVMADSVTQIGEYAFAKNPVLETVTLSKNLQNLGAYAFTECTALKNVVLPGALTEIGNSAFQKCTALETVTGADGLTLIGSGMFEDCTALKSVILPESIRIVKNYAFSGCTALEKLVLPEGLDFLGAYAFYFCSGLKSVVIPSSLTTIQNMTFAECTELENITLAEGLKLVGEGMFYHCTSLETFTIPDSVTVIQDGAFKDCTALNQVDLPDQLITLDEFAFYGTALTEITIPESVTDIGKACFSQCASLRKANIPNGITVINDSVFAGCPLEELSIPEGVTSIGFAAFSGGEFAEVHIPEGVTFIDAAAFSGNPNLTYISLPSTLKILYGLGGCDNLKTITLPEGLEEIGQFTFTGCDGLESITIPSTVKTIGNGAWNECANLKTVQFLGDAPTIGYNAFYGVTATAYYPGNNSTWTTSVRKDYTGNITWVPYGPDCEDHSYEAVVTAPTCQEGGYTTYTCVNCGHSYVDDYTDPVDHSYEDGACIWCGEPDTLASGICGDNLTWVLTGDGTLTISGQGEMYDYYGTTAPWADFREEITTLIIGDGVTVIGQAAFDGLTGLKNVSIADSVTYIDNFAFMYCEALETIDLPGNLTGIGQQAFWCCYSLKSVVIPASVTFLDACAFESCTALTDVLFLSDPNIPGFSTGNSLFRGCLSLEEIRVEEGHLALRAIDGVLYFRWENGEMALSDYPAGKKNTQFRIADNTVIVDQFSFGRNPYLEELTVPATVNSFGNFVFQGSTNLNTITFLGDAPAIGTEIFWGVTATAYYPAGNETWTEDVMQDYGGSITWVGYTTECEHNYEAVVTAPTCTEQGYTTYTCTVCGDSYVDDYTDALGHEYEDGHCNRCGQADPDANKCGDSAWWTFENSTLTISGEGEMYDYCWDYLAYENRPWADLLDQIHTVVVEDGITYIGEAAFFWMPNLTAVSLPDSVLAIGRDALSFNPSLAEITLPANLREIHQTALQCCTALTELTLPASLMFLDNICEGCTGLKKVTILSDPELPGFAICDSVFKGCTALEEIQVVGEHISLSSVDNALYAANTLNDYALNNPAKELTIVDGTTMINNFALMRAQNLERITIPASVNYIGIMVFAECHQLESVTFLGDAPQFDYDLFFDDELTVYYPRDNATWTEEVMQDYGGNITWVAYTPECTEHIYEAVVTEPTCTEQGYTTYTCTVCGDSYVGDYTDALGHEYEDGHCTRCGEEEYTVRWYSGTTSLKGTIDLNMYVILSENLVNDPETFVRFTFEYRVVDVPMADAQPYTTHLGEQSYRFSCPLFAKQVADQIVVQVMRGDTPVGAPMAYSAMQYCKNLIRKNEDPEQVAMCKAMLNYATAAQLLFNYNTDNLANASLSDADKNLPDVDASAYQYTVSNNQQPGIKARSATMMMESEIRIRVYFELKNGHTIDEYTFTIDGVEVQPQQNADGWFIESEGILAKEMENMHDFCFGGITVHYGALSYVNSKLKSDDPLEVNLAKALYAYYIAAEALLG